VKRLHIFVHLYPSTAVERAIFKQS